MPLIFDGRKPGLCLHDSSGVEKNTRAFTFGLAGTGEYCMACALKNRS